MNAEHTVQVTVTCAKYSNVIEFYFLTLNQHGNINNPPCRLIFFNVLRALSVILYKVSINNVAD